MAHDAKSYINIKHRVSAYHAILLLLRKLLHHIRKAVRS
jgi:hypothetical protein